MKVTRINKLVQDSEDVTITPVEPYVPQYDKHGDLIREREHVLVAAREAENEVTQFNKGLVMDTRLKSLITALTGLVVAALSYFLNIDLGEGVVAVLATIFGAIAGLFWPTPKSNPPTPEK